MAIASSIFLSLGFILSVVIAPQLRIWTWGPTMVCLSLSTLFALPAVWKERRNTADLIAVICGSALVFWLAARAVFSPVVELAESDGLLVAMAAATFISFRAIYPDRAAQRVLIFSISCLTLASVFVIAKQVSEPGFTPVFPSVNSAWPSGFYGHYGYCASFFVATSLLLAALALHHKDLNRIVRVGLGIIAVLAFCSIYYTKSRGALVGAAGGLCTLLFFTLVLGKRDDKKWFAPVAIALPITLIAIVFSFISIGTGVIEGRGETGGFTESMDNSVRLYLLGIAMSCIQLHPLIGGGARSYSWECFRFWDFNSMGAGTHKPEHVHNEFVQTVADYGIVGGALLLIFIVCIIVISTIRTASKKEKITSGSVDAIRLGGLAGFAGLFIESNFEGIFRIPPGAILLSLCFASICASNTRSSDTNSRPWITISVLMICGITASVCLLGSGIKGARISQTLWPVYFSAQPKSAEGKANSLSHAIDIWPLFSLHQDRARLYQQAATGEIDDEISHAFWDLSLSDFKMATELHPFDPTSAIGRAVVLSDLGRNEEAESYFYRAIELQGDMEAGFKARYHSARHWNQRGLKEFSKTNFDSSIDAFAIATRHIEESAEFAGVSNVEGFSLRVNIHENYGRALEEVGDYAEAMKQYDFTVTIRQGQTSHYRAAILLGNLAVKTWGERRGSDALRLFMDARSRINFANVLPPDVTPEKKAEWIKFIDSSISYLKGANYEPSKEVKF